MANKDSWAERRELLEYLLKDYASRGGKVVIPPQTALYDPKVLDQINVSSFLKHLQGGGPLEVSRILLPSSASANGVSAGGVRAGLSGRGASVAGDNPFGSPAATAGVPASASVRSYGGGASAASGDNPFSTPAAPPSLSAGGSSRHARHVSADNPFAASDAGGGANPFSAGGGGGGSLAGDAALFSKKSRPKATGVGAGAADPPVTTVATSVKLSYSTGAGSAAPSPSPRQRADSTPGRGRSEEQPRRSGDGDSDAGGLRLATLELPELETGQTDDQLRDLAYLLFAACATGSGMPQHAALLPVLRQQLCIDEARAADVARVLRHIQPGGAPHLIDALHPQHNGVSNGGGAGGWRPSQRASLELLLRLIAVVRPSDFEAATPAKAFKGFLRWKDVTVAVLERQLAAAVAAGWTGDKVQLRKMLARMHGAARRADVRGEGDFEEEEYGEATRVLAEVAGQLAEGCATGMRFPWAVRVRLCEILVTALFDTVEEGAYIDEAALVLQFLDSLLWPALGLSAPAALAVSAWVHFSMYLATGCKDARLLRLLKQLIAKLAGAATDAAARTGDPFGLGPEAGAAPPAPADELSRDAALASQVANHIVDFVYARLCDFHAAFPKGEQLGALLDVFAFACRSRGDGPARLAGLLAGAVAASTEAQFGRLCRARLGEADGSTESRLLELASLAHEVQDAHDAVFCSAHGLAPHLPEAAALGAVRLHAMYGMHLEPWLRTVGGINSAALDVFRTANALEQRLAASIRRAVHAHASAGGAAVGGSGSARERQQSSPGAAPPAGSSGALGPHPAVSDALAAYQRWDLAGPLKRAMLQWVSSQVANMHTWAARALQTEKWRPLGSTPEASHCASAAEVSRMTSEALDALYAMDVPMPREVPAALLEGIDAVLRKYVTHVNDKLGPLQRLIPPLPPTTRYKKDVVVKQETAEMEAAKGTAKGKKPAFLASVPPVESSPDYTNITSSLTTEALAAAACSLHYLAGRADGLVQAARERQLRSAAAHSASSSSLSPDASPPGSGGRERTGPAGSGSRQLSESGCGQGDERDGDALSGARTALQTGMQYACKFLATRVVFWEQRTGWLELLYRHHVSSPASRIEPLLEALNGALGALCPAMPEPVRTAFARHLLLAALQAFERVLLDGGPCRWFTPADVAQIDQDLHKLRSLFHADGEGLDREAIDGELERVRRLLPLLKAEVGPLMDLLKTARTHGTAQLSNSSGAPGSAFDESTLLRVLAHRPERNGSKMLKQLYKLPKKAK